MATLITFQQLRSVIYQQGIVILPAITPDADFRQDLRYKTGDLFELAQLIDRSFDIPLSNEQASELTTVKGTVNLLNRIGQLLDLAERLN